METSPFGAPLSGPPTQRHTAVSPVWSPDSAWGALLWVLFAGVLNAVLWQTNPALLG